MIIKLYFCNTIIETATSNKQKIKIMKALNVKQQNELNNILDSDLFNELFDFETEKKEIEQAGWTYKELQNFGKQLAKKIK